MVVLGDEIESLGEVDAQLGEHRVRDLGLVGDDQQQVTLLGAEPLVELGQLRLAEELGGRRAPTVALAKGPDQTLRAQLLGAGDQAVELGARHLAAAGVDPADRPAPLEDRAEDLELGLAQGFAEVDELEAEARVGPVGAEARRSPRRNTCAASAARAAARRRCSKTWASSRSLSAITSSTSTKDISMSSWVKSGWRSARRSSSRKQRAIW